MKKLLALILIFPIFISAEDIEYPIELTCVGGSASVMHIFLTEEQAGSWFKLIDPYFLPSKKGNELLNNKKINLKKYRINEKEIVIVKFLGRLPEARQWTIDRRTGYVSMGGGRFSGSCSKGFKEFNDNQI